MIKIGGWVLTAALFLFACLNFNTTQNFLFWELSVVVTEYGHWIALLCVLLLIAFRKDWKLIMVLAITTGIYLIPTTQLYRMFPRWENDLTGSFGSESNDQTQRLPDWKRLWIPKSHPAHPEIFRFDETLKLDLDFFRAPHPHAPFIVMVHGGGWNGGERSQFADMNQYFADEGYAVASIDYRLAPAAKWPAQRDDVVSAVNYLKAHASELGIDENQWVIFGRSAGGQIAESLAYSSFAPAGLKGCIAFYSPSDMNYAYEFSLEDDVLKSPSLMRDYLGGDPKQVRAIYNDASPILFVNANSVPTLLMHGPRDPLVWVKHSERLYAKLQAANVPSVLIRVPWGTHGFDFHLDGPGGQIATFAVGRFLGKVFGSTQTSPSSLSQ